LQKNELVLYIDFYYNLFWMWY